MTIDICMGAYDFTEIVNISILKLHNSINANTKLPSVRDDKGQKYPALNPRYARI